MKLFLAASIDVDGWTERLMLKPESKSHRWCWVDFFRSCCGVGRDGRMLNTIIMPDANQRSDDFAFV